MSSVLGLRNHPLHLVQVQDASRFDRIPVHRVPRHPTRPARQGREGGRPDTDHALAPVLADGLPLGYSAARGESEQHESRALQAGARPRGEEGAAQLRAFR
jgi:hypothetical protein